MAGFANLKDLINILDWSKPLLCEMFEKRKSFAYKYDHAVLLLGDEARVETLVQKGIIRQNGPFLELDEQFLEFFEQVLEVNEEINTSYIGEQVQQIRQQIHFYLQENNENRRYGYLKAVKSALRKTGRIVLRNIIDLNRNIENTFKAEPNYAIKLAKLEGLDEKRRSIAALIGQTELLVTEQEQTFFATASDDELRHLVALLRNQLTEARHNLIETQKQIIEYLNQVAQQNRIAEKIKQLKYLKDQFELAHKSNIQAQLAGINPLLFEPRGAYPFKLSLEGLEGDEYAGTIRKVAARMRSGASTLRPVAEAIASEALLAEEVAEVFINLEELKQGFLASGHHLFAFVLQYRYPREVSFEEKVNIYCQLIGMFEADMVVTESFQQMGQLEYALVTPK